MKKGEAIEREGCLGEPEKVGEALNRFPFPSVGCSGGLTSIGIIGANSPVDKNESTAGWQSWV